MMFQEHLKSCGYCQNIYRATKLAELGHMIKGTHMQGQKEKEVRALLALLALLIIIMWPAVLIIIQESRAI